MKAVPGKELAPMIANGQLVPLVSHFWFHDLDQHQPQHQHQNLDQYQPFDSTFKATVLDLVKEAMLKNLSTSKVPTQILMNKQ